MGSDFLGESVLRFKCRVDRLRDQIKYEMIGTRLAVTLEAIDNVARSAVSGRLS